MKKILYLLFMISIFILNGCKSTQTVNKSAAYKSLYEEKPVTILLMPPINRSTNIDAKGYFHSTLLLPLANAGYYVLPPLLSMETLKKESAYDAELFLDTSSELFGSVFGADVVLFTIIHKWEKSAITSDIFIEIEYILKSTKTNTILYSKRADVTYDASISTGMGGWIGLIADLTASAINTALTKHITVARKCNTVTFEDLPAGKYSLKYLIDGEEPAGISSFQIKVN